MMSTSSLSLIVLISVTAAAGSLLIVAAFVQTPEEITYIDPTFNNRNTHKTNVEEEAQVEYASIALSTGPRPSCNNLYNSC
ncbi:hypothetical protein G5714_021273 [Onychostoma macrolepis]|uniref:Uncharacterized protein n=1 Tax=Onychostoma macrolepis TaxID=369639 RepID=A0A7J6BSJ0_9TELE|nr:hypothetical protein G5714_021273 [Onychostoma macrolepis]